MRIGVDARPLTKPNSGIGRYTQQLLDRLIKNHAEHDWYLYTDQASERYPTHGNVTERVLPQAYATKLATFTCQLFYPYWASADQLDVFWSPRHHLPVVSRVPSIVTIHDLCFRRHPETMEAGRLWTERLLMPVALRKAQKIVCVSKWTQQEIEHFYPLASEKTSVIYEASSLSQYPTKEYANKLEYFLYVGSIEPRKNLETLLSAINIVNAQEGVRVDLKIASGNQWHTDIQQLIKLYAVGKRVSVHQDVTDAELANLYANATAIVVPSLYEGFGLPIVEAFQFGKPVIANNMSSLPEIAGTAGVLVDSTNPDELAAAIASLNVDSALRRRLTTEAAARSELFSWDLAADQTLEVLVGAAASHSGA